MSQTYQTNVDYYVKSSLFGPHPSGRKPYWGKASTKYHKKIRICLLGVSRFSSPPYSRLLFVIFKDALSPCRVDGSWLGAVINR